MWKTLAEIGLPSRSRPKDYTIQDAIVSLLNLTVDACSSVEEYLSRFWDLSDVVGNAIPDDVKATVLYVNLMKTRASECVAREILLDVEHDIGQGNEVEIEIHLKRAIRDAQLRHI